MLWLCLSLPQLPLEALRARDDEVPTVVTTCEGNARWVVCCNRAAEQNHLRPSINYTVALATCPQVNMLERNVPAERSALERLAGWAYQFSSTVVLGSISSRLHEAHQTALWIEIGASLKLFGGFRALLEMIESELRELNYTYRLGVGPTLEGAALLARAEIRIATTSVQSLYEHVRHLPVHRLALSAYTCQQLVTAGVRTIGLVLELPRDALAKRFGPEMSHYLARLIGEAPDPRPTFSLPPRYDSRFDFDFEIKSTESLLFPLKRMLREFAGFLRGLDVSVQSFNLVFEHSESASTSMRIGLSMPDRSPEKFLALVREQLERITLPAPTIGLRLIADHFSAPTTQQSDLFSHSLRNGEEFSHTIDRLSARLGEGHVYGLKATADHRPEASWSKAQLDEKRELLRFPERPLWLLPEPKPLQLSSMPQVTSGPERIESGWWDAGDIERDYYIVRTRNGADLWVYRDRTENGQWYLHGFWG
jgi:protein ImuB